MFFSHESVRLISGRIYHISNEVDETELNTKIREVNFVEVCDCG